MTVHPRLRTLFSALDDASIGWCLLRGEELLAAPTGDVDLLVADEDLLRAHEALLSLGFVALRRRSGSWHRDYLLPRDAAAPDPALRVDLVSELTYGRTPPRRSGLAAACLARRRSVDGVQRLDPSDQFWTTALHCMLDKGAVSERRAAELTRHLPAVRRGTPVEDFVAALCGAEAPDAVLAAVRAADGAALVAAGAAAGTGPRRAVEGRPGRPRRVARRLAREAGRRVYVDLWRAAGLGAEPRAARLVDQAGVDVAVLAIRRRPWHTEVTALAHDRDLGRLADALRSDGFHRVDGSWVRARRPRIERVRLLGSDRDVLAEARPAAGRRHWLVPTQATRADLAASEGAP